MPNILGGFTGALKKDDEGVYISYNTTYGNSEKYGGDVNTEVNRLLTILPKGVRIIPED